MAARATKTVEFFDGQVIVRFSDSNHVYSVRCPTGFVDVPEHGRIEYPDRTNKFVKVPSTTTYTKGILDKPKLRDWAVNVCLDEYARTKDKKKAEGKQWALMRKGGSIGSEIHEWVGCYIDGEKLPTPSFKEVQSCISAFKSFVRDHKGIEFVATEHVLYHPILDVCGTLDVLFEYKGMLGILDVKTSPYIYPEMLMQLACYREMVKLLHEMPKLAWVLQLSKYTGSYLKEDRSPNHKEDWMAFAGGHFITNWVNSLQLGY